MKKAILNLDTNFFSNPGFEGNGMVVKDFNQTANKKRSKWIEVNDFLELLPFKKRRGSFGKKTTSLIYQFENFDFTDVEFIHFGMHNHVYSYESWSEFNYKTNPQQYAEHNSFLYFFKIKQLKKMIWVYPDYYTNEELMKHFENTYFELSKKNFKITFKDFEANILATRFKDIDLSDYNVKHFNITLNQPSLLNDEDLMRIRDKIG